MRPMTRAVALAAAITVCPPAGAQTWQVIGTPDNSATGAYWNNPSDDDVDGAVCNVGAILTNTPALTPSACSNRQPGTMLPLVPTRLGVNAVFLGGSGGSNPGGFLFSGGTYRFDEVARVAGDARTTWGVITTGGTIFTSAQLVRGAPSVAIAGPFAIWITQALPLPGAGTIHTSNMEVWNGTSFARTSTQQFAVFTGSRVAGAGIDPGGVISVNTGDEFYVGMEDNVNGGRGFGDAAPAGPPSDRDYNDIIIRIRTFNTPEPASGALLLAGVLVLAVALHWHRRRGLQRSGDLVAAQRHR